MKVTIGGVEREIEIKDAGLQDCCDDNAKPYKGYVSVFSVDGKKYGESHTDKDLVDLIISQGKDGFIFRQVEDRAFFEGVVYSLGATEDEVDLALGVYGDERG